ncbi:hypothetical protein J7F03_27795 [Streptomyces sp. ISL-43]|uniref:cytochrome c-type biogenesis protein CcmH n=1 Tax=Streptomyces sp. ISL-43 TaxID=2819183 RepID=UPI001BE5DE80|nr:cytochrome c-type biogenesis protein CcmH [Streptomyces sp. ISL-43]MBT2450808.1 hypothetical protein [Streptomyces sp. ISL-43]
MESLGYALAAVLWGGVAVALLVGASVVVMAVRWRRKTIADMEPAAKRESAQH